MWSEFCSASDRPMQAQFGELTASELYCPRCRQAQPVRERLLLILPDGEMHEYVCRRCGSSLGQRTVTGPAVRPPAMNGAQPTGGMTGRRRGHG